MDNRISFYHYSKGQQCLYSLILFFFNARSEQILNPAFDECEILIQNAENDIAERMTVHQDDDHNSIGGFSSNTQVDNVADRSAEEAYNRVIRVHETSKNYLGLLYEQEFQFNFKKGFF